MSIRHSTRVGYGFIVTRHEYYELQENDEDLWDEFCENDYAFAIDSWNYDTTDYFFGLQYGLVEEGHAHRIPYSEGHGFTHDQVMYMINEFKKFFPNHKDMMCHDYVLSCIV